MNIIDLMKGFKNILISIFFRGLRVKNTFKPSFNNIQDIYLNQDLTKS